MKKPIFLALIAIFLLSLIACDDKEENPPEITREFTDLILWEKNITLIDRTNGTTDLKDRGIYTQIQNALNSSNMSTTNPIRIKFNQINDFAIVIESGADYIDGYSAYGHEVRFRENQLLEFGSGEILGCIEAAIEYDITIP